MGGGRIPDFETEANKDSLSTFDRMVWSVLDKRILSFSVWSSWSGPREYFPALAGLVGQVQENIFLPWLV